MKAVLCPICDGEGKLRTEGVGNFFSVTELCHGCEGKGWVMVEEDLRHVPDYSCWLVPWSMIIPKYGW